MTEIGSITLTRSIDDDGVVTVTADDLPELASFSTELLGDLDPKIVSVSLLIEINTENARAYYEYHTLPDGRYDPEQQKPAFGSLVLRRTELWEKKESS